MFFESLSLKFGFIQWRRFILAFAHFGVWLVAKYTLFGFINIDFGRCVVMLCWAVLSSIKMERNNCVYSWLVSISLQTTMFSVFFLISSLTCFLIFFWVYFWLLIMFGIFMAWWSLVPLLISYFALNPNIWLSFWRRFVVICGKSIELIGKESVPTSRGILILGREDLLKF